MAVEKTMPILIVDDYNTMVRVLRNMLRQLGFSHIDEASDGRTALQKMKTKDYKLIISDMNMSPMTGADLVKQVRAAERTRDMPVLMIANDAGTDGVAAQRAGADSYLLKPVTAQTLKTKLVSVLGAF